MCDKNFDSLNHFCKDRNQAEYSNYSEEAHNYLDNEEFRASCISALADFLSTMTYEQAYDISEKVFDNWFDIEQEANSLNQEFPQGNFIVKQCHFSH